MPAFVLSIRPIISTLPQGTIVVQSPEPVPGRPGFVTFKKWDADTYVSANPSDRTQMLSLEAKTVTENEMFYISEKAATVHMQNAQGRLVYYGEPVL